MTNATALEVATAARKAASEAARAADLAYKDYSSTQARIARNAAFRALDQAIGEETRQKALAGLLGIAPRQPKPFRIRARDRNEWEELPPEARLYAAREMARRGFVLDEAIAGMIEGVAVGRGRTNYGGWVP